MTSLDSQDLTPLLRHLEAGERVDEPTVFPRGTLLPDGRLDLCKQNLGAEGAALVARALRNNHVVTSLLLGADHLGDVGASEIAHLAAENETLTTLFFACNVVGEPGTREVAHAIGLRKATRGLWMKRNPIGPGGAQALAAALGQARALRTLDLAQTGLSGKSVRALAAAIAAHPSLERLYLSGNDLGSGDLDWIGLLLAEPSPVRALFLSANRLGDEGALKLAPLLACNRTLTTLALGSNGLSARGIRALVDALRAHPTLVRLELSRPPSTKVLRVPPDSLDDEAMTMLTGLLSDAPALQSVTVHTANASKGARAALKEARANAANKAAVQEPSNDDVRAIRSVYRAGKTWLRKSAQSRDAHARGPSRSPPLPIEHDALTTCADVLRLLSAQPALLLTKDVAAYAAIRAEASRLVEAIRAEAFAAKKARGAEESTRAKTRRRDHDRLAVVATGIRAARAGHVLPEHAGPATRQKPARCYVCKDSFTKLDSFYDALCPRCASENHTKREASANLDGRCALVTGGRVKIGYRTALRLLRGGARVIVTTRFPYDAARRYASEPDFAELAPRLAIFGLDFRSLRSVEELALRIVRDEPFVDLIVNNAAQTVRRPASSYAELIESERLGPRLLPPAATDLRVVAGSSALLAQTALLEADTRPLDVRAHNSWELSLGEVHWVELLETHHINAFAPFVLVSHLLPALLASPHEARFVINVSAMEGKFDYRNKIGTHPHTNMAKAALNMLTRTAGPGLAERRIYMTSVDTGWITNEHALPTAEKMAERGWGTPLDEEDGASRVLDPVFRALAGEPPLHSVFLKDYKPTTW